MPLLGHGEADVNAAEAFKLDEHTKCLKNHELQHYQFKTQKQIENTTKLKRARKNKFKKQFVDLAPKDEICCWFCIDAKADIYVADDKQPLQFFYCEICNKDDKSE